MRRFVLALALLCAPLVAFAQSDARKVAVFVYHKDGIGTVSAPAQSANTTDGAFATDSYTLAMAALDRMGVPYDVFNCADSVGGWRSTMGDTRPAGVADSTWFRQKGYFMTLFCLPTVGSSGTQTAVKVFQDGRTRGTYFQSPLSGRWGIPCLAFTYQAANSAGVPFYNGTSATTKGLPQAYQSYFDDNGDSTSTSTAFSLVFVRQPFQSDSVTSIISVGDTSTAAGGTSVRAWRWNNNAYYYAMDGFYQQAHLVLLGLAEVFRAAGYVPRRKLNLHWTLDHLYPEQPSYTAPADSFLVYARANKWRPSIAFKAHGAGSNTSEYANSAGSNRALMNTWANEMRLPVFPHSHVVGVGNWYQATSWNFSTFADTNIARQRWNFMESAISDTLGLPLARGYERTAGLPGDGLSYPQFYILAQNGYTDVRCLSNDSIGVKPSVNLHAAGAVWAGGTTNRYVNLPWRWTDPASGRSIWVHAIASFPGDDDTTWANMPTRGGNATIHAYTMNLIDNVSRAILFDADWYWHPNYNLQQSAATSDRPMQVYMRRLTYLLNRLSNIVTVEPSYRPKFPRRTSYARP